jgi:RHS repeat-associated protein
MPVQAYLTNGQQLVYDNDVNGNRVRNTISGTSDNFYFNGADGKTEAVSLVAHGSNLIYNILGAGGDNLGQVKVVSASPTRYYYLKDHLGSIKVTVNTAGAVVGYDDYYPYGMVMTGRSSTSSADGRYKFTGKERDASTGLDYFGARYYDSWNGRWDQVDPHADIYSSWSVYNYALCNSIITIDPVGKDTLYFNHNGNYTGRYSKGGENIGNISDENGNYNRSFSFNDPTDMTSLESTRDANGNLTDQNNWISNGDGFVITGLNMNVEKQVDNIVSDATANINQLPAVARIADIAYQSRYGAMDFANKDNPLGKMLSIHEIAVIGDRAYNRFDAGNYFWGAAMSKLGFSPASAQYFARMNERIFNGKEDQNYDQTAIWNGATRIKK